MKLSYHFGILKITYATEYIRYSIYNLFTGLRKRVWLYYSPWLEIAEGAFQVVLCNTLVSLKKYMMREK